MIKAGNHWNGYFIKNLIVEGLVPPAEVDTMESGEMIWFEPMMTELRLFNADSLAEQLIRAGIYDLKQVSEESIQKRLTKKVGDTYEELSLPQMSHDCDGTMLIYGSKMIHVSYRNTLIDSKELHIETSLIILFEAKGVLRNLIKD